MKKEVSKNKLFFLCFLNHIMFVSLFLFLILALYLYIFFNSLSGFVMLMMLWDCSNTLLSLF